MFFRALKQKCPEMRSEALWRQNWKKRHKEANATMIRRDGQRYIWGHVMFFRTAGTENHDKFKSPVLWFFKIPGSQNIDAANRF
jgi:hypothetical protein